MEHWFLVTFCLDMVTYGITSKYSIFPFFFVACSAYCHWLQRMSHIKHKGYRLSFPPHPLHPPHPTAFQLPWCRIFYLFLMPYSSPFLAWFLALSFYCRFSASPSPNDLSTGWLLCSGLVGSTEGLRVLGAGDYRGDTRIKDPGAGSLGCVAGKIY